MFKDKDYPLVKLSSLLKQNVENERIIHTLSEKYITVALYGKGVRERSIERYDPKPFTGYRVNAGQFIYSRIDARNGAFGIIPNELHGAVVSKDFPVFDVEKSKILENYLLESMLDENFIKRIKSKSLGSTNRQRIKEDVFLNYEILLPPIEEQKVYVSIIRQLDKSKFCRHVNDLNLEKLNYNICKSTFRRRNYVH